MFKALTLDGQEIFAREAERQTDYLCPHCRNVVRLKAGKIVVPHFFHKAGTSCQYAGEGYDHINMKHAMIELFRNKYRVQLETEVIPGRIADIFMDAPQPVVVECQASPITVEEWENRTRAYNRHGISVFWLFHLKRLDLEDFRPVDEIRVPAEIRHAHRFYYGRVYVMDREGEIKACKLIPVYRDVDYEAEGLSYSKTLKATKDLRFYDTFPQIQFFQNEGFRLAGLKDHVPRKKKVPRY